MSRSTLDCTAIRCKGVRPRLSGRFSASESANSSRHPRLCYREGVCQRGRMLRLQRGQAMGGCVLLAVRDGQVCRCDSILVLGIDVVEAFVDHPLKCLGIGTAHSKVQGIALIVVEIGDLGAWCAFIPHERKQRGEQ